MKKRLKILKWLAIGITSVGIIVVAVIMTMYCTHYAQVEGKITDFKQIVEQLIMRVVAKDQIIMMKANRILVPIQAMAGQTEKHRREQAVK